MSSFAEDAAATDFCRDWIKDVSCDMRIPRTDPGGEASWPREGDDIATDGLRTGSESRTEAASCPKKGGADGLLGPGGMGGKRER